MKKQTLLFFIVSLLCFTITRAQTSALDSLQGLNLKVYFSKGHKARATAVAQLSHDAIQYSGKNLDFIPEVRLLVLNPTDWPLFTKMPVYGMPHYANSNTLIVAAENNALWKSFIPEINSLPVELADRVKGAYLKNGALTMEPFFDLLALHELGHAFHQQGKLIMQRQWMAELFCNVLLHTYIAENKPEMLPSLTVFPEMVVQGGTSEFAFTTLEALEKNYHEIGSRHPKNYGWYQSRLHLAAKEMYDKGGKEVLLKLWNALKATDKKDDKALADILAKEVHQSAADVMLNW